MKTALEKLLLADLYFAADALGLEVAPPEPLEESIVYEIINEIEIAILKESDIRKIAGACALLWTHYGKKFELLGEYIYDVLTRIGFSPVAPMLANGGNIAFSSIFGMLETTVQRQVHSIVVFGRRFYLTRFQHELWTALNVSENVAVSAPTSAGKSFLIGLALINRMFQQGGTAVYIVPNLTLMSQVINDLAELIKKFDLSIEVRTHLHGEPVSQTTIFVLTQERLIEPGATLRTSNLTFLVVDEIQNLERAFELYGHDERSRLLLDVLVRISDEMGPSRTVIIGPRIREVGTLATRLFRKRSKAVVAQASPVTNICYAITPVDKSQGKLKLAQYTDLRDSPLSLIVPNTIGATGFAKAQYTSDFDHYLLRITRKSTGALIFSPTSVQARRTAHRVATEERLESNQLLDSLAHYIRDTVSSMYDLAYCIERGVTFHHGKMPQHVRNVIEYAIGQRIFKYVTCTTTLLQGVNIPAQSIFIRNPNLFLKRQSDSATLSGYEIANLRGRAGRLLRDFVGRTFVLDGTSFDSADQGSLFELPSKSLDGSYDKIFEEHRSTIIQSIVQRSPDRPAIAKYMSSVMYTDADAAAGLHRKGIRLTEPEVRSLKLAVLNLTVPKEVCRTHRYWDPFELQILYDNRKNLELPDDQFDYDCARKIEKLIYQLAQLIPDRVHRLLKKRNTRAPLPLVIGIASRDWACEKPLHVLLDNSFARENSDNTESAISMLQNTISYGLPSLLSPLYQMSNKSALLLGSLENGAYRKETILQLEHNIPRETAIMVSNLAKANRAQINNLDDLKKFVQQAKLGLWDMVQFRHLMPLLPVQVYI